MSQRSQRLDLRREGTHGDRFKSETYVSIEGMSSSRTSHDAHRGRWSLVDDIIGRALVALDATDGRRFIWTVVERPDAVLINETSYTVAGDRRCA